MKEKIKILMVLGNTGRGGSQAYVMTVFRNIDKTKFQVDFVASFTEDNDYSEEIKELGGTLYLLPRFNMLNYFSFCKSWNSFFYEHHYDIVHGHATGAASIYLSIAKRRGCITVSHSHSDGYRGGVFARLLKYLLAKRVRTVSDYWFSCSSKAAERLYGLEYKTFERYYEMPNAIDVEKYKYDPQVRENVRKALGVGSKTILYGHVGSFSVPKNHKFLLEVFRSIHEKDKSSKLLLVGSGPLETEVLSFIAAYELTDSVILKGTVSNVPDYLYAMDAMIFPSLFEGFGIAVLEAEASGLYTIVSDNIPKEVCIVDCVKRLSLEDSIQLWVDGALSIPSLNREHYNDIVSKTKYNINTSIQQIQELYIQMYKERLHNN